MIEIRKLFSGRVLLRVKGESLRGIRLEMRNLEGADLRNADLREAILIRAKLSRADLSGADLRGADLTDASLSEALLVGANLSSAVLANTRISESDLTNANLSHANLSGAIIQITSLMGADLTDASLGGGKSAESLLEGIVYDAKTRWPKGFKPPSSIHTVDEILAQGGNLTVQDAVPEGLTPLQYKRLWWKRYRIKGALNYRDLKAFPLWKSAHEYETLPEVDETWAQAIDRSQITQEDRGGSLFTLAKVRHSGGIVDEGQLEIGPFKVPGSQESMSLEVRGLAIRGKGYLSLTGGKCRFLPIFGKRKGLSEEEAEKALRKILPVTASTRVKFLGKRIVARFTESGVEFL